MLACFRLGFDAVVGFELDLGLDSGLRLRQNVGWQHPIYPHPLQNGIGVTGGWVTGIPLRLPFSLLWGLNKWNSGTHPPFSPGRDPNFRG